MTHVSRRRARASVVFGRAFQSQLYPPGVLLRPSAIAVGIALLGVHGISNVLAGPTGGQVTAGAATINQSGATTTINQTTARAALNWQSFSIGASESVIFQQPSSSSVALNRVVGPDPSAIYGSLRANGHVFLINPSGILFGRGASVDVAGLVASTLNISNNDFMAGRYVFSGGQGSGAVVNHGNIRAAKGGYVALIGNQVTNTGTIVASNGSVALGAGDSVLLDFNGDGLLSLRVNAAAAKARIDNTGEIHADGGRVIMNAQAKNALLSTVLNVEGIVTARGIVERDGHIYLDGGRSGVTRVAGTLDASSASGKGGEIRVLGENVGLFGNAKLDASGNTGGGTVLVGGDFQGRNPDVPNATRTYVGPDATITADAITQGDGGKVIVWADDTTRFYGGISARGGAQSGNGGFVEVSGKESLAFDGAVNLSAPNGARGSLLLDPKNGTVTATGANDATLADNQLAFAEAGNGADVTISAAAVNASLETANTTLQANNDLTINAAIAPASGTGALTLQAGRSIVVNEDVTLRGAFTASANDANANAAFRDAGAAAFTMANGKTISTSAGNGNIQITVGNGPGGAFASGDITVSNLSAGTGHVLIRQAGATLGSDILRTPSSLIQATSVALDLSNPKNSTGTIGTSGNAIAVNVTDLAARSQGAAVFVDSPAGDVRIGTAGLGELAGIATFGGDVTLTSAGRITQTAAAPISASALTTRSTGRTVLDAENRVARFSAANADSGRIELNNLAPTLTVTGITNTGPGDIVVTNSGNLTTASPVIANGGEVSLSADGAGNTLTIGPGGNVAGGSILLFADRIALNAAVNAGSGKVGLATFTSALEITLGGGGSDRIAFGASSFSTANITAGVLQVGDGGLGGIDVVGPFSPAVSTLSLVTAGTIDDKTGGNVITVPNLALSADRGIGATHPLSVSVSNLAASAFSEGSSIDIRSASGFTIARVDEVSGIDACCSTVTLTAGGPIAQTADARVNAATLTLSSVGGAVLNNPSNSVRRFSATNASSGNVELRTNRSLDVGDIANPVGNVTLFSTGPIAQEPGTTITANLLTTTSSGGTVLNEPNAVSQFTATNTLSEDDGLGNVELTSTRPLTINGISNRTADDVGDIALRADSLTLSGNVDAGTGRVTLSPFTPGTQISIGSGGDTRIGFGATSFSTANITAGTLQIGNSENTGGIRVVGPYSPAPTTLHLTTAGTIDDTAGGGTNVITVPNLALTADAGIGATNPVAVSAGALAAESSAGGIRVRSPGNLRVGIVDDITGIRSAGGITLVSGGTITQAVDTRIEGGLLTTSSVGGTTLNEFDNFVTGFSATNTGSGNIELRNAGPLEVAGISNPAGNVTLTVDAEITQTAGGGIATNLLTVSSDSGATLNGPNSVTRFAEGDNNFGNVALTNTAPTLTLEKFESGNNLTVVNTGNLTVGAPLNADLLTLTAAGPGNTLTVTAGISSDTATFVADRPVINAEVSAGKIAVAPWTPGLPIQVGNGATDRIDFGAHSFTTANLSSTTLQIGNTANTGGITVAGSFEGPGTLHLATQGAIDSTAAGNTLTTDSLALSAGTGIGAAFPIRTTAGEVAASNSTSGNVSIVAANPDTVTVSAVDGVGGITSAGDVRLEAEGRIVQFDPDAPIVANNLTVLASLGAAFAAPNAVASLTAMGIGTDLSFTNSAPALTVNGISTSGGLGAIALRADNPTFAGAVNAGTGLVALAPFTPSTVIRVGNGAANRIDFGTHAFTTTNITAETLRIGDADNTGGIIVAGPFSPGFAMLSLKTGGAIDGGAASNVVTATNLSLSAATGIGATNPIRVAVTNLAARSTRAGSIDIRSDGGLNVASIDLVSGITTASIDTSDSPGTSATSGSITLIAGGAISSSSQNVATGDATARSATAQSGSLQVTATGGQLAPGSIATGDASVVDPAPAHEARTGNIALSGAGIAASVLPGAASGGVNVDGVLDLASTGLGAAGDITIRPLTPLRIRNLSTAAGSAQAINIFPSSVAQPVTFLPGTDAGIAGSGTAADGDALSVTNVSTVTFNRALEAGSIIVLANSDIVVAQNIATSSVNTSATPGINAGVGGITLTTGGGSVTGTGAITTGAATVDGGMGTRSAASGSVLIAAGSGILHTGPIRTGAATVVNPAGANDSAVVGNINLSGGGIGTSAAARQVVAFGAATGGNVSVPGLLTLTSTNPGAAGDIFVSAATDLTTGVIAAQGAGASIDIAATGTLTMSGLTSTAANAAGNSGSITLSTAGGDIGMSGISTGAATLAGTGSALARSGTIRITAGGNGVIGGTGSLATGSASVTNGVAGDTARVGDITLSANRVATSGDPLDVTFGAATAGAGTQTAGLLNIEADSPGVGSIYIDSGVALRTGTISATGPGAFARIRVTGGNPLTIAGPMSTNGGGLELNAGSVSSIAAGTITTTAAANSGAASGAVAINASGAGGAVNLAGSIDTTGAGSNAGAGSSAGAVSIITTNGTITVTDITARGGASTFGNANGGIGGAVLLQAAGTARDVSMNGNLATAGGAASGSGTTGAGTVTVSATRDIATTGTIATGGGNVGLSAARAMSLGAPITTTAAANSAIPSGSVTLTAANGSIVANAIDASGAAASNGTSNGGNAGAVTLTANGAGSDITLNGNVAARRGTATGTGIPGSGAVISATANRDIAVNASVDSGASRTTLKATNGAITGSGVVGSESVGNSVELIAATRIDATTRTDTLAAVDTDNDIKIINAAPSGTVTVGTVGTTTGIDTPSGDVELTEAGNGGIVLGANITSGGGHINLTATAGSIFRSGGRIKGPPVRLSAPNGAVGASGNRILTESQTLRANVGTDLFVTNSVDPLTEIDVTLRPSAGRQYSVTDSAGGLTAFNVTPGAGTALNVTDISSAGNLVVSVTNAAAAGGDISVGTIAAGTGGFVSLTTPTGSILGAAPNITGGSVSLIAPTGVVGATGNAIITNTPSLIASVGTDLFVANTFTGLSRLDLTLRPMGSAQYSVTDSVLGTFNVTDAGAGNIAVGTIDASGIAVLLTTPTGSILSNASSITAAAVGLSAPMGAIGAAGNRINTITSALIADVGTNLFVTNTTTPLSSVDVTLRPTGPFQYSVTDVAGGLSVFDVTPGAGNALNVNNVSGAVNLNVTVTNAAAGGAIAVSTIGAGAGDVGLRAQGAITQPGGAITADGLSTESAGGITLNRAANAVSQFSAFNETSGNVELTNSGPLDVRGIGNPSGNVTLNVSGAISGGSITAKLLTTSSTGGTALTNNTVERFAATNTASSPVEFENSSALSVEAINNAGRDVTLDVSGAISQTGAIAANLLTTTSSGGTVLNHAGNAIAGLNATNSTSGNVELTTSSVLDVAALTSTVGDVALRAGGLTLSGPLNAAGRKVTLAPFAADTLIQLGNGAANRIDFGANFFDTANITVATLQVGDAGNAGGIRVAGAFNPGFTTLHLATGGAIDAPAANSTVTATNLALSAGTDIGATNAIGVSASSSVAAGNTSGDIRLSSAGGLAIGTVDGVAGITSARDISLLAGGAISQTAAVRGRVLTTTSTGGTILNHADNALDGFAATNTTSGTVELRNSRSLSVARIDNTGRDVTLAVTGAISQTGAIAANRLTTSSIGGTVLNGSNAVTRFDATNATAGNIELDNTAATLTLGTVANTAPLGHVIVANTGNLTTAAPLSTTGGDVSLTASGAGNTLTIGAAGAVTSGRDVTLVGDAIVANANVNATGDKVTIAPFTADTVIRLGDGGTGQVHFGAASIATNALQGAILQIGNAGNTGGISVAGNLLTFSTLHLATSGAITATAADNTVSAANLALSAGTGIGGLSPLRVGVLGDIAAVNSTSGAINIRGVGSLSVGSVDGVVGMTSRGPLTLASNVANTLTLNAPIRTFGGDVVLAGGGVRSAAGGTITTTALPNSGLASGAVTITTGTQGIDLAGAIVTAGANNSIGAGSAGGNVTLETDLFGDISVAGINASGGSATPPSLAPGAGHAGGAAGAITLGAASAVGSNVTLTGNLTAAGGAGAGTGNGGAGGVFTFNHDVILGNNVTIDARGGNGAQPGAAGNVTFAGTLDADAAAMNRELAISAEKGTVIFERLLGASERLSRLDVTAASVAFNESAAVDSLTLTADSMAFAGGFTGTGAVLLQPTTDATPIFLGSDPGVAGLALTSAHTAFGPDSDGGYSSITIGRATGTATTTVNESVRLGLPLLLRQPGAGGAIVVAGSLRAPAITLAAGASIDVRARMSTRGGTLALTAPMIASTRDGRLQTAASAGGAASSAIEITSTGPGSIDLAGNIRTSARRGDDAGAVTITSADGPITVRNIRTFGGAAGENTNGGAGGAITITAGGGHTLTLNGLLGSRGGSASDTASPGAGGAITLDGRVRLGRNASIDTSGGEHVDLGIFGAGGNVRFAGTVDAGVAFRRDLIVNAGSGNVIFEGVVGGDAAVRDFDVTANNVAGNAAGTTRAPAITARGVSIGAQGTVLLSSVTTTGRDDGNGGDVRVIAAGPVDISTIVARGGAATAGANGRGSDGGNVDLVSFDGAVTVGDIDVSGSAARAGSGRRGGNGGFVELGSETGPGTVVLRGNMIATGGAGDGDGRGGDGGVVVVNGPATLAGDVTFDGRGGAGGADGRAGDMGFIGFGSTVDGAFGLSINADAGFSGAIGGTTPLSFLTLGPLGSAHLEAGLVRTTGNQTFNDLILQRDTIFRSSGGDIAFAGSIDSGGFASSMRVETAGRTTFGDNTGNDRIGLLSELLNLSTDAGGTTVFNIGRQDLTVTTLGTQTYGDDVQLQRDTTLVSEGAGAAGNITFDGLVNSRNADSPRALTVNTAGATVFNARVGGNAALLSLTTDAGGTTLLNAPAGQPAVTTATTQTYNDAVQLARNTTLVSTGNALTGGIAFYGSLDSQTAGTERALTVNTAGTTTFAGPVGTLVALSTLTTDAPGMTEVGGTVRTRGNQSFLDPVAAGAPTVFTSDTGTLSFSSTLAGRIYALTLSADALQFLGGANSVSGTGALVFQPLAANRSIGIGGAPGTMQITAANLAALRDGFESITVGRSDGTGATTINAATFRDPLVIRQPGAGGTVIVNGALAGQDNASVALIAGSGITLNNAVSTASENIELTSPSVTVTGSGALNSGDELLVTADTLEIGGSTMAAGPVTLRNLTAGRAIRLGGEDAASLSLKDSELDRITASTLRIGRNDAAGGSGAITIGAGGISPANVGNLHLITPGAITGTAGGIVVPGLVLETGAGVNMTFATTDVGTLAISAAGQSVTFVDANAVSIGTVDGIAGVTAGTFNFTGGITQTAAVTVTGASSFNAGANAIALTHASNDFGGAVSLANTGANDVALTNQNALVLGTLTLGSGTLTANGAGITQAGSLNKAGGAATFNAGAGDVTFNGALDGGFDLIVNSGGTTTFASIVGGTTALASLTTDAAGTTRINGGAVRTSGAQTYNDAVTGANVTLTSTAGGGHITATHAANDFTGTLSINTTGASNVAVTDANALQLGALTLGSGTLSVNGVGITQAGPLNKAAGAATFNAGAGDMTFTGTLDGGFDLVLNSSGTTTFGSMVGGTTRLASLTTDAAGTTRINTTTINTTGNQAYGDAVVLGANAVLTSSVGGIAFNGTLDGGHDLILSSGGTTTFGGIVGGTTRLASLTTDAAGTTRINTTTINTTGNQTYGDPVVLGASPVLTSSAGDIAFTGALDGGHDLILNSGGTTTFGGIVGGTTRLASLTTDAAGTTRINTTGINTTGNQTYGDPVVLGANAVLTSGAGDIAFTGALDGGHDLILNASGTTTFGDLVGGTTRLASLTTDAAGTTRINTTAISTTGNQAYGDAVVLGANAVFTSSAGGIAFNGTLDGGFDLILNASGTTTFGGVVGGATRLASLTTDTAGTTRIDTTAINTTGNQVYGDAVVLGANAVLASSAGGLTFTGTLDGGHDLILNSGGTTTFGGIVGGTTRLASLTTDAAGTTRINTTAISTTGNQTYGDPVVLGANAVLTSSAGDITFTGTLDGGHDLTLNSGGMTTFGGLVGGTTRLASLTTGAAGTTRINTTAINTTGNQTYGDPVVLGANAVFTSSAGGITFAGTLDGGHDLILTSSGATTFGGIVGGTTRLASLTTDAAGTTRINTTGIFTTGNQTYGDPLVIGANAVLTSSAGNIAFAGTIDADLAALNRTLAINAPAGTVTFSGNIGSIQPLADLDVVSGPNTTVFNAATPQSVNVSAGGGNTVSFTGNVLLNQNLTFNTDGSSDNNIVFNSGISSGAGANRTLNIVAGSGNVSLGGVGGNGALGALSVAANRVTLNGNVALNGGGSFNFNNVAAVLVGGDVLIVTDAAGGSSNAGNITFNPATTIDAAGASATLRLAVEADGGGANGAITLGRLGPGLTLLLVPPPRLAALVNVDDPLRTALSALESTSEAIEDEGMAVGIPTAVAPPLSCTPKGASLSCD